MHVQAELYYLTPSIFLEDPTETLTELRDQTVEMLTGLKNRAVEMLTGRETPILIKAAAAFSGLCIYLAFMACIMNKYQPGFTNHAPLPMIPSPNNTNLICLAELSENFTVLLEPPARLPEEPTSMPCIHTISPRFPYLVSFTGNCTVAQMKSAYESRENFALVQEREFAEENRRTSEAYAQKAQQEIAYLEKAKMAWSESWDAQLEKNSNPTPLKHSAVRDAEAECQMDEDFRGWPGYIPQCKKAERELLGVSPPDNCTTIKARCRKLNALNHPDRNKTAEAKDRFIKITSACEKLCPESDRKRYTEPA